MPKFKRVGNEWIADLCLTFVRRDTLQESGEKFDASHPYHVAYYYDGAPTGANGQYETFRLLRDALACAARRNVEYTLR